MRQPKKRKTTNIATNLLSRCPQNHCLISLPIKEKKYAAA